MVQSGIQTQLVFRVRSELERSSVDERGADGEDSLVESTWLRYIKWEIEAARVAKENGDRERFHSDGEKRKALDWRQLESG
ncbi:hypothetical protein TorRG33x02_286650 [Trema orientale]|uniref:Uncharacterized protein n=1 Tax=Trema orientale TaxID=63057 RepID=A0A2P5CFP1_TREOI|nr:hypothetical protein TorRG33x02_286650 [Trema orientale]